LPRLKAMIAGARGWLSGSISNEFLLTTVTRA
jgi:hypothetical protein